MQYFGLKSWLKFDNSAIEDFIPGNTVGTIGTAPTISSTNAFIGNAAQFNNDGTVYIDNIQLGNQDFTVDFWCYMSSACEDNDRIFSVVCKSTGYMMVTLQKTEGTSNKIKIWANNYAGCTSDYGATYTTNSGGYADRLMHIALVYQHKVGSVSRSTFKVYVDGVKVLENGTGATGYNRLNCRLELGGRYTATQYMTGSIDEFCLHDGIRLWTANFTPPTTDYYNSLSFNFDTARLLRNPPLEWRYENPGDVNLLTLPATSVTTDIDKSVTEIGFYQPTRQACFGIAATKELWMRCDIYCSTYNSSNRWRIYSEDSSGANGITCWSQSGTNQTVNIWHNGANDSTGPTALQNKRRYSIWLHMKSDATDGVIEYRVYCRYSWMAPIDFSQKYTGNVNDGNDFANFYIQNDGTNQIVSNIVIANYPISIFEGWLVNEYDTELYRTYDSPVIINYDTIRRIAGTVTTNYDTVRNTYEGITINYDTVRDVSRNETINYDTVRNFPHQVDDDSNLRDYTVTLQEQQLTDNVTFTMAESLNNDLVNVLDTVDFSILDYHNNCKVEQVQKRGILASCKCTSDIDEILYQQLSYSISKYDYNWTYEYNEAYLGYQSQHPTEEVNKMPCANASTHISQIAAVLGKTPVLRFRDYVSTMNPDVKNGNNYSGLIGELFGWTSRLPHIMINVFLRGNTLYVTQRGYEPNTVNLDESGIKLTIHTKNKKLMRTMWGTDANAQTEVVPVYRSWISDNLTPFPRQDEPTPGGGGTAQTGMNHLVEETEVTHGEERVVTNYHYTDMGDGKQFLDEETTKTYIGGSLVDEVHTYHKPVSFGQAQVYSTDDDGVLGTTVSPSNFDERITPYQYGELTSGGGYTEAFVDGAHDEHGNYYPAVYDGQGNRYIITGHTAHKEQIGTRTRLKGHSLVDTSFPVDGTNELAYLTQQIEWLNRRTEETITVDLYDYPHVIDFNDKIIFHGNTYHLRSNTAARTERIVNRQSLVLVRWY